MMKKADNQLLVIFGASGDLTKRKLLPSLFELYVRNLLPEKFRVLGASRTAFTDEEFREEQRKAILDSPEAKPYDPEQVGRFLQLVHYLSFDSRTKRSTASSRSGSNNYNSKTGSTTGSSTTWPLRR